MPKTKKKFEWEVYDENGNFLDILSMTRHEKNKYQELFPTYKLQETMYTDDGDDDTWETGSDKTRDIYSIRLPKR